MIDPKPEAPGAGVAAAQFPIVRHAECDPSAEGRLLRVAAQAEDGRVVRFALSIDEVQHFVAFLLVSVGKICALRPDQGLASLNTASCRPIPATSIALGEPRGEEGCLSIAVGQAELVFAIPLAVFEQVGRTMLTMSAQPRAGLST